MNKQVYNSKPVLYKYHMDITTEYQPKPYENNTFMSFKYKLFIVALLLFVMVVPESIGQTAIGDIHYVTDDFSSPFSIYAADIDNDGYNDIVAGSASDSIVWFRNNGVGQFSTAICITTELDNIRSVFACDIDNDGDVDILSASRNDSTIAWIENDGNAGFGSPNIIAMKADYIRYVSGYDMDNDNDIDIVVCYLNSIVCYINDGDCNFGYPQTIATTHSLNLCVADINGDNYYDVFTTSLSDEGLLWLKNEGNGNYTSCYASVSSGTEECYDIDVDDINSNGKMDLIVSFKVDSYYGKIGWYEYDENDSLVYKKKVGIEYEIFQKVVAGDLSSDSMGDIFAAHNHDRGLYWFERKEPFFQTEEIPCNLMEVGDLLLSDMDMDGDKDVVISSIFSQDIMWFENLTLAVLLQPESQFVCTHDATFFSVQIKDALSYTWQVRKTDATHFSNIDESDDNYNGVITNELQIINAQSSMNNFQYRCKASNGESVIFTDTVYLQLVNDTEAPLLVVKDANLYLTASVITELPVDLIIDTLSDNCNYIDVILSKNIFSCADIGENSIDLSAIDGSGNEITKTALLNVIDTVSPVVEIGSPEIEIFTPTSSFVFDFDYFPLILYYDNCEIESITNSLSNSESLRGVELSVGDTDVLWSVFDNSGNSSQCSQKIRITNSNEYNIYPNPADYYFIIKQKYLGEYQMKVFDMAGKLCFESEKIVDVIYHFDCQHLKRVTYIIQIDNGLELKDYKVTVSR